MVDSAYLNVTSLVLELWWLLARSHVACAGDGWLVTMTDNVVSHSAAFTSAEKLQGQHLLFAV
jgi:hypothetical protein